MQKLGAQLYDKSKHFMLPIQKKQLFLIDKSHYITLSNLLSLLYHWDFLKLISAVKWVLNVWNTSDYISITFIQCGMSWQIFSPWNDLVFICKSLIPRVILILIWDKNPASKHNHCLVSFLSGCPVPLLPVCNLLLNIPLPSASFLGVLCAISFRY